MKTIKGYKIWQIVYPIGIYYVVSSLTFFALEFLIGTDVETYMLRQMVCSAVTIPFIMSFYMQDKRMEDVVYGDADGKSPGDSRRTGSAISVGTHLKNVGISIISAATLGIAVNNLLAMTPLLRASSGFQTANENFFGGQLFYELMGSCLLIPIAEELLYRGVVYKRLRLFLGMNPAILFSALIFGIIHANLVQFIYAAVLGLLLAFLMEKTGFLYTAILGHMAANLVAVLRQETGWLAFSYEPTVAGIGFTLVMLATGLLLVIACMHCKKGE